MSVVDRTQWIEWGVAGQAYSGQAESGDQYVVEPFEDGMLVAVVDGLGHGERAAFVAKSAAAVLREHAHEPVLSLVKRCHSELRGTRGAVMSLASFRQQSGDTGATMTWVGIGNVAGALLRANGNGHGHEGKEQSRESLFLRGGILGYQLPTVRDFDVPVAPGDTLVFATDGLRSSFSEKLVTESGTPQHMADHLFDEYRRGTDDALVLVARYVGGMSA